MMALGPKMTADDYADAADMLEESAVHSLEETVDAYRRARALRKTYDDACRNLSGEIKTRVTDGERMPGVSITRVESVACTDLVGLTEWLSAMDAMPEDIGTMLRLDVKALMKALDRDRKLTPGDMERIKRFFELTVTERLNVK